SSVGLRLREQIRVEYADVGQIPVPLVEIQAVADDEPIRDFEPHVADGNIDFPALRLGHEGADLQGCGLPGLKISDQVGKGQSGVDDVLDHEDVAALDVDVQVLEDPDDTGAVGRGAVAGDGHEVDLAGNGQLAHQIRHEEDGSLEDAYQQRLAARVVARNLLPEFGDATAQRFL